MRALFYDTETTGLPQFGTAPGHESWPDVVQFAGKVVDLTTRKVESVVQFYVIPEREISEGAARVTGHTIEHVERFGMPRSFLCGVFAGLAKKADITICHNRQFDDTVMKTAFIRQGLTPLDQPGFCTKDATTALVKAPKKPNKYGRVMGGYKWPTLTEAHAVLCQGLSFDMSKEDPHADLAARAVMDGAHDAMNDVNFMIDIFWKVWDDHNIRPRMCVGIEHPKAASELVES